MAALTTKEQAARQLWLLYFNRILLNEGKITEQEYGKIKLKIQSKSEIRCL